ncbi:MAG TPA: tRNA threonylcarbamoyladenosine dehydratase [Clostridia bacterium]|jgi:tRNA A37 threonylcarbamoyladenosine dehydratase|nr:tRNA threonylcarbamoyladenosine dehydratase [Clostridiaceae bacterium]HOF26080.1 tRNA threonylcarbamoyladenosine dehydratase [Clostridia bacterium]HOM34633.1 tRNA threonylcarbamoyladenosine dehydratase [Clostridia bacterium]HOR89257.1 tRNA threonylcarbamoyladenosine dehydratase [Clostridia bacterium]HOT70642.1 tRNA threonylcarbamoyladenosine dehydratase [Clostridia bacterium]
MSDAIYDRTIRLIGEQAMKELRQKKVAIIGLGGVGSYVLEALARAGIGHLILADYEKIEESNINRQILALHSTVGKYKTEVALERVKDINPDIKVTVHNVFVSKDNIKDIIPLDCDYVIDAIDTVSSKIDIIVYAKKNGINIISCMGTGNKIDNTGFKIAPVEKTDTCPLARKVRKILSSEGITGVDVLYSVSKNQVSDPNLISGISYVPSTAGLIIAGYVIRKLINM